MPGATGSGKGFSKWALGFVPVELAIILSAFPPISWIEWGEGQEVLGERKAAICLWLSGLGSLKDY